MPIELPLVEMNWYIKLRLESARIGTVIAPTLNAAANRLRLFQNDFGPKPGDELTTNFVEATYDNYVAQTLEDVFAASEIVQDGQVATRSSVLEFPLPAVGGPQTIYGAYATGVVGPQTRVIFALRFSPAVVLSVGGVALRLQIVFEQWNASTLISQACD